jgi:hypothetical protein
LALEQGGEFIVLLIRAIIFNVVYRLVVILIGRLRLSPSKAIEAYMKLAAVIPDAPAKDEEERVRNTEAFKTTFVDILKEAGFEADTPMIDDDDSMPKM